MSTAPATPDRPHPSGPRDNFHHVMLEMLRAAFPPAIADRGQGPSGGEQAINDAMAALHSAGADQLLLAAQYFSAAIQALDRLVLAHHNEVLRQPGTTRSIRMLREARRACSSLFRPQTGHVWRSKEPRIPADIEQAVDAIVAEAFPGISQHPGSVAPPPARADFDLRGAEQYAITNRNKAMLIRSLGRLPKRFDAPPPTPGVMNALIHGTSPALQKLYKKPLRH